MLRTLAGALALSGLLSAGAQGAVIDYDEARDGDLDGSQSFTLDGGGVHTWRGSGRTPTATGGEPDIDSFSFAIADGTTVIASSFTAAIVPGPFSSQSFAQAAGVVRDATLVYQRTIVGDNPSLDTSVPLPWAAGGPDDFDATFARGRGTFFDFDWTLTFETQGPGIVTDPSVVPLPAGLPMLAGALLGLGLCARARRIRSA